MEKPLGQEEVAKPKSQLRILAVIVVAFVAVGIVCSGVLNSRDLLEWSANHATGRRLISCLPPQSELTTDSHIKVVWETEQPISDGGWVSGISHVSRDVLVELNDKRFPWSSISLESKHDGESIFSVSFSRSNLKGLTRDSSFDDMFRRGHFTPYFSARIRTEAQRRTQTPWKH